MEKKATPEEVLTEEVPPVKEPPVEEPVREVEVRLEDAISAFINEWKGAWEETAGQNGNLDTYISFSSDQFASKRVDRAGRKKDKGKKGRRKRWIRVEISDIQIYGPTPNDQVEVRFHQYYKSSNYSGKSTKTLILHKAGEDWKIIAEKSR